MEPPQNHSENTTKTQLESSKSRNYRKQPHWAMRTYWRKHCCKSTKGLSWERGLYRSLNATVAQSKNFPFGVNTKIELKNKENTSLKTGIWQGMFQL
jgi:hypothetical protein